MLIVISQQSLYAVLMCLKKLLYFTTEIENQIDKTL